MGPRTLAFLLVASVQVYMIASVTDTNDFAALNALKDAWENVPANWTGADPCGSKWEGISCNNSRLISVTLSSMGLKGQLPGEISSLSELEILDLSYNKYLSGSLPSSIGNLKKLKNLVLVGCNLSGSIPDSIGSLQRLVFLSLNSNGFSGAVPPSIGTLSNLYWLDLSDNNLNGPIPVSTGTTPGLDMLVNTKHFHLGMNQLSGTIPDKLFSSKMTPIDVLLNNNNLVGTIPLTLALVQSLEVIRLDGNLLTGPVPSNLNNLTKTYELSLSNNGFFGPLPNFTGMHALQYLDMSNNSFDATDFPIWITNLKNLTTIMMESTQLRGQIPISLFSLPLLETVVLSNNELEGNLDFGASYAGKLQLVDLRNNLISNFTQRPVASKVVIVLVDNPICQEITEATKSYCIDSPTNSSYVTHQRNCVPAKCFSDQISSPNCKCAYPFTGVLLFRAPSFSGLGTSSLYASLENSLLYSFYSLQLPVDSVSLSNPRKGSNEHLELNLGVFPSSQDHFNQTEVSAIGFALANQTFKPPEQFGPFFFIADTYEPFAGQSKPGVSRKSSKSSSTGIIVGAAAGGAALLLLLLLAGVYARHRKKSAEERKNSNNGNIETVIGKHGPLALKRYTFSDIKKMTNSLNDKLGQGGYGSVYKGQLPDCRPVAVKVLNESKGNGEEFINEVASISRTSHVNIVTIVGFCLESSKRALIYDFMPNGSLEKFINKKNAALEPSRHLGWDKLYQIAVGVARGLEYLHRGCNTRIVHFDIKPHNILLDEDFCPKISDFGLARLGNRKESIMSMKEARGTIGYIAPEVFNRRFGAVSHKSDVYGYGMLILEMAGGRDNDHHDRTEDTTSEKFFPNWIYKRLEQGKENEILQGVTAAEEIEIVKKLTIVGLWCIQTNPSDRPSISKVIEMLEGPLQNLKTPPEPVLSSPQRLASYSSTASTGENLSTG
ncbi:hypothetical protein Tsubulata_045001 [Turnera subulata]|uniref:non-specific serine/threonine protein kinase n=1 Tax=Turnera subulata TaxID=218843 RepID=A0A9Q0FSN2_9ROSI|nr:hypothetical protein Tsubulata_045001 [Turnera subulata]